jgi:threonine/homoserine/homoserine lactone efflux protein
MLGTTALPLFVASGLLLNMTPGPDTLYILGRTATHGFRGGSLAALGIGAGTFVHTFAAAAGLSALLAASATAFTVVKWVGAAYLAYVGITMLMTRVAKESRASPLPQSRASPLPRQASLRQVFVQGFLTNVLNPKVALFFLAFLPQFVDPHAPSKAFAFVFLGIVFNVNGTLWNLLVAWSAATVAKRIAGARAIGVWFNRAIGALFVYLGVRLAT